MFDYCINDLCCNIYLSYNSRKATGGGPEKKIVYHQYEELLRPYIDLDSIVGIKAGFDTSRHHENGEKSKHLTCSHILPSCIFKITNWCTIVCV